MSPVVKGYAKAFFGNILGFYMGCRRMYWGGGEYLLRRSPAYVVCASDIHEISGSDMFGIRHVLIIVMTQVFALGWGSQLAPIVAGGTPLPRRGGWLVRPTRQPPCVSFRLIESMREGLPHGSVQSG